MENTEQTERDLLELSRRVATLGEYFAWAQRCEEFIKQLEEHNRVKRPRLSIGVRQSLVARIARLEGARTRLERRFIHSGGDYSGDNTAERLVWREIDTAFENRILTGAVINADYIEPRQFLEDAKDIVLEHVQKVMERHNNVKVNTVFNGKFVSGDKSANKSVNTRNYELFRTSDLHEWYERRVVEPTLASLEEFQERDSGWALSRILDLTVNINKYNPMRAGCHIKLPREITMKRAVINVQSKDNACFAWAVVATLHPAEDHVYRESSYPHYTTVLNLQDIEFPMTLSQIKKFELHNNISINVYCIEKENNIVPIRLSEQKKDRHVNLLYMQDSQDVGHFAWIKNLSRLVSSQWSCGKRRQYICDRKERLPFVVYADLECVLRKTDGDPMASTYTFQHHQVFSVAYYVHLFHNLSDYDSHFIIEEIATAFEGSINVLPITKEKLHDTCLPPRESFYSSLTGDTVSESNYAHAENVWKRFSVRTLGVYSDLYLKTDVLLLADVFENFRNKCIESYGLDPAYYYTLSGYTWDAMLKHTNITFELLTDIDMVMFIERGIRGGLSQCSGRYARANNKYMPSYDPSKPSSYMMYFDVNNLYGWAMCQPLPYADFRWVDDISDFDVSAIASDSTTGYILEVDLEYPQHLHDAHADLPFCPTRDKPPGKRQDKLLATLYDKKRYVIHYSNLQQCMRHGLRIAKIHRVLQFAQSAWLRDYIELNTRFRTRATNDFEKNLYKLMNNAVFGKTMENVRNHVDVKLLTNSR
ncbi:uncharacterized protein [Polyergus mexicanus]|uniref:uncharacterized protein n=1 Tax=Polyergus mexicanus TaxID=615972 RepID=UPI0038B646B8